MSILCPRYRSSVQVIRSLNPSHQPCASIANQPACKSTSPCPIAPCSPHGRAATLPQSDRDRKNGNCRAKLSRGNFSVEPYNPSDPLLQSLSTAFYGLLRYRVLPRRRTVMLHHPAGLVRATVARSSKSANSRRRQDRCTIKTMASSSQGLATSSAARRRLGQVSEHLAPSLFEPFVGRTIHTSVPIRRDPPSDPAPGSPPFPSSVSPDNAADARNRPVWQFLTASAFHGKPEMRRQRYDPRCEIPANHPIKRWVDATLSQHPSAGKDRTITGGQDWWFVQPMQSGSGVAMGVADGVGGWSDEGVDPSCVAQGLMYYAAKEAASGFAGEEGWMEEEAAGGEEMVPQWSNSSGGSSSAASTNTSSGSGPISNTFLDAVQFAQPQQQPPTPRSDPRPPPTPTAMARKKDPRTVHPHELLAKSYDFVMRDPGIHGGASTSLVATMNSRSGVLRWANLGDSGLLVLRNYKVIKQSRVRCFSPHGFVC